MKRFFGILLAVALSFCLLPVFAEGTASETKEPADGWKVIPNYAELAENRILIGQNPSGEDIYEFGDQNFIYDKSGYFRLLRPDEVLAEMDRRGIQYTRTLHTSVYTFTFFVVTLPDGYNYALETLKTTDDEEYIPEHAFRRLCQYYFGFGYDYSGV